MGITLTPDEIELWKMVDVRGFGNRLLLYRMGLSFAESYVGQGRIHDARKKVQEIIEEHGLLIKRYSLIDLTKLDQSFPVEIIQHLQEEVLPKLNVSYQELESSLERKNEFDTKIKECRSTIDRMQELGDLIRNNERYSSFRKLCLRDNEYNRGFFQ